MQLRVQLSVLKCCVYILALIFTHKNHCVNYQTSAKLQGGKGLSYFLMEYYFVTVFAPNGNLRMTFNRTSIAQWLFFYNCNPESRNEQNKNVRPSWWICLASLKMPAQHLKVSACDLSGPSSRTSTSPKWQLPTVHQCSGINGLAPLPPWVL